MASKDRNLFAFFTTLIVFAFVAAIIFPNLSSIFAVGATLALIFLIYLTSDKLKRKLKK
jgi:Flp pilus assembly protein TadB